MIFEEMCTQLETKIQNAYEAGTTLEEAEKLAAEFLYAQIKVSNQLKIMDLSSRMRKSGTKAIKGATFLAEIAKADKKPSDSTLEALVNSDPLVKTEQAELDTAEVDRDALVRYYDIFLNAHIFFRGVARGQFGG